VVLLSGGLDSCVSAGIAAEENDLAVLHCNYGQRTESREQRAFHAIADHYRVADRLVIDLDSLRQIGGSSLTDRDRNIRRADLQDPEIPDTYVPFRNAHMLSAGVSWAETIGAKRVFIGAVEEDSSGYPDCRKSFFEAFSAAIAAGTRPQTLVEIQTPLIDMDKQAIVRIGMDLDAPLALTWSCYQENEVACGTCDSCALRLRGFARAGLTDPIAYRIRPDFHTTP